MNTITLKEHRNDVTTFVVGKREHSDNYYLNMVTAYVTGKKWIDLEEVTHGVCAGYYVDTVKESTVTILEYPDKQYVKDQANLLAKGRQVFLDWQRDEF